MMSIQAHNVLDYVVGAMLILAPYVFGFADIPFARDVFFVLSCAVIGYSLLTDYHHSMLKVISPRMHMTFDVVCGAFVMLSPWIYGYREELTGFQFALHFIFGGCLLALAAFTAREKLPPSALRPESEEEVVIDRKAA